VQASPSPLTQRLELEGLRMLAVAPAMETQEEPSSYKP